MDSKSTISTNQGLQQFAISNRDFEVPLFESISIADDSLGHDPRTNVAIPSTMAVDEAKSWVDDGSKL
ncbi:MAG: DUF3787 domain-containing protein [Defluviitaleaceae bacterium]|nr:DUF3787 domain-containing protein [Defluviitaleaceae bacterium]